MSDTPQEKWERKGDCNQCGWCCQFLMVLRMTVPDRVPERLTPDLEKFYDLRHGVKGEDGRMRLTVHGFAPCQAHDTEKKQCTIYQDRPQGCRDFPTTPEQIEGTPCSHWFERGEEARGGLGSPHPTPPVFKV